MKRHLVPAEFHLTPVQFHDACLPLAHRASALAAIALRIFSNDLPEGQTEEDGRHLVIASILDLIAIADPSPPDAENSARV